MNQDTLIVTICSFTKITEPYLLDENYNRLFSCLQNSEKEELLGVRNRIFRMITSGEWNRDKKPLNTLHYNKELLPGLDFGEKNGTATNYAPAIVRYAGRFFRPLGSPKERLELFIEKQPHLLIISGLYGILDYLDMIQLYSCSLVNDPPSISLYWQKNRILSRIIKKYCHENHIKTIFDFSAVEAYRNLIDWDFVNGNNEFTILHAYNKQNPGDNLLGLLGEFTFKYLNEELRILGEDEPYKLETGDLYLLRRKINPYEPSEYAVEKVEDDKCLVYIVKMVMNIESIIEAVEKEKGFQPSETVGEGINNLFKHRIINQEDVDYLRRINKTRNDVVHEKYQMTTSDVNFRQNDYKYILDRFNSIKDLSKLDLFNIEDI